MRAYIHPLTCCLLPPLSSISLDEEVAANEEGIDDDDDATVTDTDADTDSTADDAALDDNNCATMPPKVKPLPTKPTKKDIAAAAAQPPPPAAAAAATSFSVDAKHPLTDNYYADGTYDYADVVFRINGTMQKGEHQVRRGSSRRSWVWSTARAALASLLGTTRRWRCKQRMCAP